MWMTQLDQYWIPAFAGMTKLYLKAMFLQARLPRSAGLGC